MAILTDSELENVPSDLIEYKISSVKDKFDNEVHFSQFFYVELKNIDHKQSLYDFAKSNRVNIIGNNVFMPSWYILECNKESEGNSIEMANIFYTSGLFKNAQPDLLVEGLIGCVNDTYFNQQWALNNISAPARDIDICDAWNLHTGCSGIIVAVVDEGIEQTHPDLSINMYPVSYDAQTGSQPSVVRGSHGTAVAGVIGAASNNSLGIAGVAPNSRLMSISDDMLLAPLLPLRLADGINFAWQYGAHIINNSWSSNSLVHSLIDQAINDATSFGRGGLGCVVIFISHNDGLGSISYPSGNPNVLAVGATDNNDQRATFSNYGTGLDVVAPGVGIYTTDLQGGAGFNTSGGTAGDYYANFQGTSAAAPIVSGIAALILSINPNLTQAQVRHIIESSTDKVSGYSYTMGAGENPTLTWNNEVGYGRVNARKAIEAALGGATSILGPDLVCTTGSYTLSGTPPGTVNWSTDTPSVLTINSAGAASRVGSASGRVAVTASITTGCGPASLQRYVHVGLPIILSGTMDGIPVSYPQPCSTASRLAISGHSLNSVSWTVTDGSIPLYPVSGQPHMCDIGYFYDYVRIRARASNACGNADYTFYLIDPTMWFMVYPNPATNELTLQFSDVSDGELLPKAVYFYHESSTVPKKQANIKEVYDKNGLAEGNKLIWDVSGLPRGIYYLHIIPSEKSDKKEIEKLRIILE